MAPRDFAWWSLLLPVLAGACSDAGHSRTTGKTTFELTQAQADVLGFERPTVDWSSSSGTLAESTTASQGAKALAVTPSGWTEINSVSLSSLGPVKSSLSIDVRVPTVPTWGELRVILIAPSLQMWWTELGSRSLNTLPAGQYSKLSFSLPSSVETALEGQYDDLRIKAVINAEVLSAPYLVDNIDLADVAGPPDPGTPVGSGEEFFVVVPQGQTRESMFLSAIEYLQVDDRVQVHLSGQRTNVAGLGSSNGLGVHFGSAVVGHNNIFSVGNVLVRSQGLVEGFVRTQGSIDKQDNSVRILGAEQPGQAVPTRTFRWTVSFPPSPTQLATVEPQDPPLTLAPGAYQDLNVHGSTVNIRTGTYYFNSFNTEPVARVVVDNAAGPVFIYVRNGFRYTGRFEANGQEAQILVGVLGSAPLFLQAPFVGTLVAQNAKIELHRPTSGQHRGAWFGKQIQVYSDSHIVHVPFDWDRLPPDEEPPDSDGDKTPDPGDSCALDSQKTDSLLCGCNVPETDSDGDIVPDCLDWCPTDPNKTHPGVCGCLNQDNLQPAGTPCIVEACAGSNQQSICDGQGQCGVPDCDPIPGNCFHKVFRGSLYWFCEGPASWTEAETLCGNEPTRSLAKIDDSLENLWLQGVIASTSWVGGNDLTQQDLWHWSTAASRDDRLFWANGLPVPGRYENWSAGSPGSGDCMALLEDGSWVDPACSTTHAFVCEQPLLIRPPLPDPPDICEFFPVPCGSDRPITGPCIDEDDVFPSSGTDEENRLEAERIATACTENCRAEGDPGCATDCTGFASVPPDVPGCTEFSARERAFCNLETVDPNGTCSIDNPNTCPAGTVCGRRYECAALYADAQPRPCTENGNECDPDHHCGVQVKVCIDPTKRTKCDDKIGDACVGICFGSFACGQPHEDCAANDDDELFERCSETTLCDEPGTVVDDTNPVFDPASNLREDPFPGESIFPETEQPVALYPEAKPPGCGGEGEPDCNYGIGEHPWCNYIVDPEERPVPRAVSDADFGDKQGTGGGEGPIRFDFDPNLSISYDMQEPLLPLGDGRFHAHAEASATASAHFNLFGIRGDVNILDARGALDVNRCFIESDARLALFGFDFLPAIVGDEHAQFTTADTPPEQRGICNDAIADFLDAVQRAEKAMRDAQELIRQQRELIARNERLSPDLCEQILGSESRGLPADFPTADAPFTDCGDLSPEETINLFIRYYRTQALALFAERARMLSAGLPQIPRINIDFLERVDQDTDVVEARRETQKIANFPFFIGPIPMTFSVEAYVQYGVAGGVELTLSPHRLVDMYDPAKKGSSHELAFVDASITPFAGAGTMVFVGVGFSFGALEAKIGIYGAVSLGLISLPLHAGAGIEVRWEPDERALPEELQDIVKSQNAIYPAGPPKKYRFDARYRFGASARISNILSGEVGAMLRIKFFFFSKTWRKRIIKFGAPFGPFDIKLINGGGNTELADASGLLGRIRMPLQFVDFEELETPPPLPPLPPTGGTGGVGGSAGMSGAGGTSGSGGTPGSGGTISLRVAANDQPASTVVHMASDPRFKPLSFSRVDQLFHAGYCKCSNPSDPEPTCRADLDCCGTSFCVLNDVTHVSRCADCVAPLNPFAGGGERCENTSECCQSDPLGRPVLCYPRATGGANMYCQPCRGQGEAVIDATPRDGVPDFGECCEGLDVFRPPFNGVPQAGAPVCSGCRPQGQSCNETRDCCPSGSPTQPAFCPQSSDGGFIPFVCTTRANPF